MCMAKEKMPDKTPQTPFERFTEAAQNIFNLPKKQVQKIKAKTARKPRKKS
jgi:hypothetical protein